MWSEPHSLHQPGRSMSSFRAIREAARGHGFHPCLSWQPGVNIPVRMPALLNGAAGYRRISGYRQAMSLPGGISPVWVLSSSNVRSHKSCLVDSIVKTKHWAHTHSLVSSRSSRVTTHTFPTGWQARCLSQVDLYQREKLWVYLIKQQLNGQDPTLTWKSETTLSVYNGGDCRGQGSQLHRWCQSQEPARGQHADSNIP